MRLIKILLILAVLMVAAATAFVFFAPEQAARAAVQSERDRSGLAHKTVQIGELQFAYLEGGAGDPLILLHGFGANKDNFTRIARYLTPHYRVIAPDLAGFAESSKPNPADYTPAAQVARLQAFKQALNLGAVHVGGSSMGGQIAATWAALHPQEILSLWLLAPGGVHSAPKSELAATIEATGQNPLLVQSTDDFAATFAFVMSEPPFIPRPILNVFAQERIRNYALEQDIFRQIRSVALEPQVSGLQTPALIVWGDEDRTLHVGGAEVLKSLMPNAQLSIQTGIGHLPHLERIQGSAEDYLAFRAGIK